MQSTHSVIGAGPVGCATARALLQRGSPVRLIHRSGTARVPGAEVCAADILDQDQLVSALRGSSVVYYCAQPTHKRWLVEFRPLIDEVLEACEKLGAALVVADNLHVYGDTRPGVPLGEDTPADARSLRGRLRTRMAGRVMTAHKLGWVPTAIARASDLFGPEVHNSVLGHRVFETLLLGRTVHAVGDIDQLHTYTYIDDFGRALAELGHTPHNWGQIWHVPNAPAVTTRALLEQAAALAGVTPRLRGTGVLALSAIGLFRPEVRAVLELLPNFVHPYTVDDRAWRFHLHTRETPLPTALRHTIEACLQQIVLDPKSVVAAGR